MTTFLDSCNVFFLQAMDLVKIAVEMNASVSTYV